MLAMLLAGGQGSRLGLLTKHIAKPAVPFGGKYRIIDFSLSNCINSGIDTVGVLTQYKPFILNSYIGIGSAWDLDCGNGGLFLLPPYAREKGGHWYSGTADAIYQNIDFIDQFNPEYVLILSGDHIYKMDYSLMLQCHKEKNADVTISVIEVPWEEANRFGIMETNSEGKIIQFAEKPQNPNSNLASMGIYIFKWPILKECLINDQSDANSQNDFGKNIIPKMLDRKMRLFAYHFKDYWKDVGTVESYFSANMDLLSGESELNIFDDSAKIYSVNSAHPPHYIGSQAEVDNSLIGKGCQILGKVKNSILSPGVYVGPETIVEDAIIMPGVRIGKEGYVKKAIIGEQTFIQDYAQVCAADIKEQPISEVENHSGIIVIGNHIDFSNNGTNHKTIVDFCNKKCLRSVMDEGCNGSYNQHQKRRKTF